MATGVKLKKFDGSENVFIWLSNFENWQKFHNESDAQALLAIGCNFEGQAATWFHSLTDQQKSNMQQFEQCLKDRFAPNEATFSLMGIKQDISENTDAYLARAEKIALRHNLPELYKVQFIVNGLHNNIKSRIIAKQPKTFQTLREAIVIAKAELECTEKTGNPLSEVTLKAFAAQIKDSLREELCSLSATNSDPGNRQSKNRRQQPWQQPAQQPWQRPQQQQWQQLVPQSWQRHQQQQWQQYPHQPPQQQWQQTPQQQWQQTPTAAHGNQRGRSCPGCGTPGLSNVFLIMSLLSLLVLCPPVMLLQSNDLIMESSLNQPINFTWDRNIGPTHSRSHYRKRFTQTENCTVTTPHSASTANILLKH
nr:uncharacterized protein LOC117682149 [Crassostrea gigas]